MNKTEHQSHYLELQHDLAFPKSSGLPMALGLTYCSAVAVLVFLIICEWLVPIFTFCTGLWQLCMQPQLDVRFTFELILLCHELRFPLA